MGLRASTYTFPIVEVVHILGLTMLLGSTIAVSLRLMGWGMNRPASEIYQGLATWSWLGMVIVVCTGVTMVIAEPAKLSMNAAFPFKLTFLAGAAIFYFFLYLRVVKPGRAEANPLLAKFSAIGLLLCFFGAGVAGRSIGFV
jgi:hypothetical protein